MGQGITAGIYFGFEVKHGENADFPQEFLDCYEKDKNRYILKEDFFLKHFKGFLEEFNDFFEIGREIREIYYDSEPIPLSEIPEFKTKEEFHNYWSRKSRNAPASYVNFFRPVIGCNPKEVWLFYDGSYKAYLETYTSLRHFEKAAQAVIKNPLGKLIKMGLYG